MAGVYKGLTIKFGADTHGLSQALDDIDRRGKRLQASLRKSSRAMKLDPGNAELAGQKFRYLGEQVDNCEARLKELRAAESQIGKQGMSTEAWDALQREITSTEAKLRSARAELQQFAAEQAASGSALGKAGAALSDLGSRLGPVGEKMQSVGRSATLHVSAPIAAAAVASAKAATDIDSALTGVRKTVDATAEEYGALRDAAIEYSKVNAVSAADVLAAEELGGQLGVAKDNLEAFARVTTGLDVATNMNVDAASTNLARFMNVTQASADATKSAVEQYEAYGNAVVGLGNNLATTESEISDFSLRMASAASLAGISQADILGIGGAMSSLGMEAEAGGTAFSNTITQISMAASKGGEGLETFARIAGESAEGFSERWRSDATGAFVEFVEGLAAGAAAGDDMNVMLEELGITGIRQSDALRRLAGNTSMLTDAIALANAEWRDGSALADEVANRNESLAAKFEMLRNRVVAVADDMGEPIAEAMLQAVDAAAPLFEAIESGARAFSEMGEGEQQAVMATVALVAAFGPMTSVAGKLLGNAKVAGGALQSLARWLAGVDMAAGGAKDGLYKVTDAAGKTATQAKKASVAMGALKGAAATAAVAGIAVLAAAVADCLEKQEEFTRATDGMRGLSGFLSEGSVAARAAADGAAAALGGYAREVRRFSAEADEATARQAQLVSDIRRSFTDVAGSAGAMGIYAEEVLELAGNCEGGSDKVADLKAALDGFNSIAGTTYRVVNESTGALDVSTAALRNNADAWEANAKAQAAQEALTEIYRERIEIESKLRDAQTALAGAEKDILETMARGEPLSRAQLEAAADAEVAVGKLTADLEANRDAASGLRAVQAESRREYELATATLDGYRSALESAGRASSELEDAAAAAGVPVEEFVERLKAARVSAADFARVGAAEFGRLRAEAKGDLDEVAQAIEAVNALGIDPKDVHVTDNGEIADTEGRIIDLDRRAIGDKSFSVRAQTDQAESALARVRDYLASIRDKTVTLTQRVAGAVGAAVGNAAGGISPSSIRIPRHADGGLSGIVSRATLTNYGWVGEAGAEAIVPLTNARYVRPFARAVASEIPVERYDDTALLSEVKAMHGDIARLEVVMDGRKVGHAVAGTVNRDLGSDAGRKGI